MILYGEFNKKQLPAIGTQLPGVPNVLSVHSGVMRIRLGESVQFSSLNAEGRNWQLSLPIIVELFKEVAVCYIYIILIVVNYICIPPFPVKFESCKQRSAAWFSIQNLARPKPA